MEHRPLHGTEPKVALPSEAPGLAAAQPASHGEASGWAPTCYMWNPFWHPPLLSATIWDVCCFLDKIHPNTLAQKLHRKDFGHALVPQGINAYNKYIYIYIQERLRDHIGPCSDKYGMGDI